MACPSSMTEVGRAPGDFYSGMPIFDDGGRESTVACPSSMTEVGRAPGDFYSGMSIFDDGGRESTRRLLQWHVHLR